VIGSLTLDQLRVLVAIADEGSFSAAGRKLDRAQSAISQTVATLEGVQGVLLFDRSGHRPLVTDAGRSLISQARAVLAGAARFEDMAAGMRDGIEPELAVAIDPLAPTTPFIDSLRALRDKFPNLPVSFSTEGLGGAERRLRRGEAALALCILLPGVPDDLFAVPLLAETLISVVSPDHPLGKLDRPVTREDLYEHVQLVLSDPFAPGAPGYGIIGVKAWRFVELGRRLDFLLAGLGWCRMPEHLVRPFLADGRLQHLVIQDNLVPDPGALTIYAAHRRDRPLGRAGTWLLDDLQARLG
jgi:DNA-binding transcriptional LysR family regulator